MNVNIGGTKGWTKINKLVRDRWKIMDVAGIPDFKYDLNSATFFPFNDNMIDNYYCSHTLEHIRPENIAFVLDEMHRTLKQHGMIRIVVPDVRLAIEHYVGNNTSWLKARQEKAQLRHGYPSTNLGRLMLWFYSEPKGSTRSGHNIVFDWETLCWYVTKAKFRNIIAREYSMCAPVFRGLDFKRHAGVSLYLEAQK